MLMTSMAEKEPTAPGMQRMFQPPEWRWVQTGSVGWWLRGPWDATLLGPEGLRLKEWRGEGRLPGRSSRGCDLRQALPRARLPRHVAPVVSQGQGSQRGQAVRGPRGDRRTDHPSHRPG